MRKLPFILFAVMLLVASCSSIDCPVQNVVATVYTLKKQDGTADTLRDTLTIMTRRSDGTDTTLLNKSVGTTGFQLPIGYTNPEDTLYFIVSDTTGTYEDIAYIKKDNQPHFESVDCNISFFHTLTGVRLASHNAIDSIVIHKTAVNYDLSTEHFHIYFKAAGKREQN